MEEKAETLFSLIEAIIAPPPGTCDDHPVVVYMAHNEETNDYYIGATVDKDRRQGDHRRDLERGTHINSKFQASYDRNPNFVWKEIPVANADAAFTVETVLIRETRGDHHSLNLLGSAPPAMLGRKQTSEARLKMSEGQRRNWEGNISRREATRKHMLGTRHAAGYVPTPERIEQMRTRMIGNQVTLGYQHSEEARAKIGAFQKTRSAEHAEKIRQGHMKPVSIAGVVYPGLVEASIALGIASTTILYRLRSSSEQFQYWFYLEEQ